VLLFAGCQRLHLPTVGFESPVVRVIDRILDDPVPSYLVLLAVPIDDIGTPLVVRSSLQTDLAA
jgi:hypothetical protein